MNKKGWNVLHYALHAKNADPSVIESFINDSKNPSRLLYRLSDNGESPLTIAIKNNTTPISIFRLLLEKGASARVKDGHSYIYKTLLYDNPLEITKLFIDNGSVLTKLDVDALRKAELHVTDNDQKLVKCMKKIGKLTSTSTLLDKYRVIFVKLYQIDERLVNQFIKAF
jgi:ankyrin repeat protein